MVFAYDLCSRVTRRTDMSNTDLQAPPARPPDFELTLVQFTAATYELDRDVITAALEDAAKQLAILPTGRMLRGLENSKLARRMTTAAARAQLRPRLMRIFNAAVHLLVHYSRLVDDIPLSQLADEADLGPSAAGKLGTDLAELAAAGLLLYRPGRGRGRASTIGVPARFASDVLLRLQRDGKWSPPASSDNASPAEVEPSVSNSAGSVVGAAVVDHQAPSTTSDSAAQDSDNASDNSPHGGGVSTNHSSSCSSEKPPSPQEAQSANTASGPQRAGDLSKFREPVQDNNASIVRLADVDWILERLPRQLATVPGTRDRSRQAAAIREALSREFRPSQLKGWITDNVPVLVNSPAGFVEFRINRVLASCESPRELRLRAANRRHDERTTSQRTGQSLDASQQWHDEIRRDLPVALLAGLARTAVEKLQATTNRVYLSPRLLGSTISSLLRACADGAEPSVSTPSVVDLALEVLKDAGQTVPVITEELAAAATAAGDLGTAAALLLPVEIVVIGKPTDDNGHDAPDDSADDKRLCASCGSQHPSVVVRPELPFGTAVCEQCFAAASDPDFVVEIDGEPFDLGDNGYEGSVDAVIEVVDDFDAYEQDVA